MTTLLPGAGKVELAIEEEIRHRLGGVREGNILQARQVASCPEHLLPFLAWELSVDYWDPDLDVASKRELISQALRSHAQKGTLGSLRAVLTLLTGVPPVIIENPGGAHHTISIEVSAVAIDVELQTRVAALVDQNKRLSVHATLFYSSIFMTHLSVGVGGVVRNQTFGVIV